jgi:hypothetical protein
MNDYKGQRTKRDLMKSLVSDAIVSTVRKTGNNTLEYQCKNGDRGVQLHDTEIVRFTYEGIILNSGGWQTLTTKERINAHLPAPWRLYQEDFIWYLWNHNTDESVEFYDGIVVTSPFSVPKKSEA